MINVASLPLIVIRRTQAIPLALFLLAAIVLLFVAYIWQVNGVATSIYHLNEMEEQRVEAVSHLEKLDLELTEHQATSTLSAAAIDLGLRQPDSVHYLSSTALDVALILP